MITKTLTVGIGSDETVFPTVKTNVAFENILKNKGMFDELQTAIHGLKDERTTTQRKYNRVPCVAELREINSRIAHYEVQNGNLLRGELPTKMLNHQHDVKEALLKNYQDANDRVLVMLNAKREQLEYEVEQNTQAQDLKFELETLDLAIKRNRDMRKPIRKQLARHKTVGKTGIAIWNPDRTKFLSMRMYNESS